MSQHTCVAIFNNKSFCCEAIKNLWESICGWAVMGEMFLKYTLVLRNEIDLSLLARVIKIILG